MELWITNLRNDVTVVYAMWWLEDRQPDVGLVDAHAKSDCSANYFNFIKHPLALNLQIQRQCTGTQACQTQHSQRHMLASRVKSNLAPRDSVQPRVVRLGAQTVPARELSDGK